jgi:hypothetical protein
MPTYQLPLPIATLTTAVSKNAIWIVWLMAYDNFAADQWAFFVEEHVGIGARGC